MDTNTGRVFEEEEQRWRGGLCFTNHSTDSPKKKKKKREEEEEEETTPLIDREQLLSKS